MSGRDEDFQEVAIRLGAGREFRNAVRMEDILGAIRRTLG